jgi:hypothetical protein
MSRLSISPPVATGNFHTVYNLTERIQVAESLTAIPPYIVQRYVDAAI